METFYVTTPIYYVNDAPHIGHAYTTLAADALARYHRQLGKRVYFLTGTDEHGQKMQRAAQAQGKTPIQLADENATRFRELWTRMNISYDDFIRTSEPRHQAGVVELFQKVVAAGDIYLGKYEGWYCTPDETYHTELDLVNGNCPMCGRPVTWQSEPSYFFRMSKYQERLLQHLEEHPEFVQPEGRRHEIVSFVARGLDDLSISRTSFDWGIPVPGAEGHVLYVWVDALTNYLSALGYGQGEHGRFETFWPADFHLVGKDIVRHHAVIWPCLLMSAGVPLPRTVFAHGWWTNSGQKMSKSLNNFIRPDEVIERYGLEAFRYFVLREIPFGLDGDFSFETLKQRINSDLANDLGNLLARTAGMAGKYVDGVIPAPGPLEAVDRELIAAVEEMTGEVHRAYNECAFHKALIAIWAAIGTANKYIDVTRPFSLAKEESQRERLGTVLYNLAELLRIVAILIAPVMPVTADRMWEQIGADGKPADPPLKPRVAWGGLKPGTKMVKGASLFPRLEEEKK
jgi:methionyl-tRNA synthetase